MTASTITVNDLLDRDLAGYKLVRASILMRDHSLMGDFPAIFSDTKKPAVFIGSALLDAAKERLEKQKSKVREVLFLLDEGGASGFILEGYNAFASERYWVYTQRDHDAGAAIEWAPGLS